MDRIYTDAFEIKDEAVRSQDDSVSVYSQLLKHSVLVLRRPPLASDEGIPISPELHELEAYAKNGNPVQMYLKALMLMLMLKEKRL